MQFTLDSPLFKGVSAVQLSGGAPQPFVSSQGFSEVGISGSGFNILTFQWVAFGDPTQQNDQNTNRGLYHLRARSYDASTGRFLSEDPLPLLQRYAYATGEPGGSERHAAKR